MSSLQLEPFRSMEYTAVHPHPPDASVVNEQSANLTQKASGIDMPFYEAVMQ